MLKHARRITSLGLLALSFFLVADSIPAFAQAQVRIKDIARLSGTREYQVIGYGLITGLDGTGDKSPMSIEMIRGMLMNMGRDVPVADIQTKNCAAVVVTSMIPPFAKTGESFDVVISSIGDSKSLAGGVLLPTLLKGGDSQVYAVAQGQISVGGLQSGGATGGGGAAAQQKNHLTVARLPGGAILEREVGDRFGSDGTFSLMLTRKDATVSRKMKETIDRKFGEGWAKSSDPGTVKVTIPSSFKEDPVSFASTIQDLVLSIEEPNRVVINERTGTIIVGNRIRISTIAISHGKLKIDVGDPKVKPTPGTEPKGGSLIALSGETTVDDLVNALNSIGATPKDLICIFQAIDAAGALHGELKIM